MKSGAQWLVDLPDAGQMVEGLLAVEGYSKRGRPPEEVAIMERAAAYGAHSVFFETSHNERPAIAQAFVFVADGPASDQAFAELHRRLWSWGGVPLIYRRTAGLVQLFRCAHRPDFERNGDIVLRPFRTLDLAATVAADPWWDAERLRNGTLWDDLAVCRQLLSNQQAAQKTLINSVRELHEDLSAKSILPKGLRRRLLILSVLIAYLEARKVFEEGFFARFGGGADQFFEVLANGPALLELLEKLEDRFNGHVFVLQPQEREVLRTSTQLARFARLIEGRQERGGQLSLWRRYSFADLPVELISHIYQLFVKDSAVAVYTPHFVVRLMLGEVLSWERLDRLEENDEVIVDGACGSGIFLVEAYKRLVLHWRYRHDWKRPSEATLKRLLTRRLRGVDVEEGAVELAACSLCLALCDALEPIQIRSSVKLFPPLIGKSIHRSCFFEVREQSMIQEKIGVIVGNPPFTSLLRPGSEQRAYERYRAKHGALPDKQLAYLFLHESMEMLAPGGVLSMVQQYNFLYNQQSLQFRRRFIEQWDLREVLDFISVRGIFQKGGADTKVIIVVAEAQRPPADRQILHSTFRRSGRTDAEQGFDIDYYDMHWLPRELPLTNDAVWRADSVGGGRVLAFIDRLRKLTTLGKFAEERGWDVGEGWIEGKQGKRVAASHITGRPYLNSRYLTEHGVDERGIEASRMKLFKSYYTERRFTPPMLLVRSQSDFHHAIWERSYLTYSQRIIGFCAPISDSAKLRKMSRWLDLFKRPLQAYLAATSPRIFTQKSSALSKEDIVTLPYDPTGQFRLTPHEEMIVADVTGFYRELIRRGEKSAAMTQPALPVLPSFNRVFTDRINGVYGEKPLQPLPHHTWPGVICQPYVFGGGSVDWTGALGLKERIGALLAERRGGGLHITRIARIYDGAYLFLLKPDRLRYWLGSIALRDADETLADLARQGF